MRRIFNIMDSAFSLPCSHLSRRKLIYVFFLGLTVVFFIVFLMDIQFHSAKSVIRTVGLSPEKVQTCGAVLIKTESSTNAQVGVAFDAETQNEFLDYLKATQCTIAEESPSTPVSDYRYYVYFEENNGKTLTVFFTSNGYMSFKGNSYKLNMPGGENLIDFLSNHV